AVMLACLGLFIVAPFIPRWWLPKGVSTHYWGVDALYYFILFVTGFFFILTEAILVYFMYAYTPQPVHNAHHGEPTTDPVRLSTNKLPNEHQIDRPRPFIPPVILLSIAFSQVSVCAKIKYQSRMPPAGTDEGKNLLQVEISARQFEWRMRYPSPGR